MMVQYQRGPALIVQVIGYLFVIHFYRGFYRIVLVIPVQSQRYLLAELRLDIRVAQLIGVRRRDGRRVR